MTDDSGTRTFGYNAYGERISDSLSIDSDTHLITETSDNLGRSTGFVYSKNGSLQHTVTTGYGTDGRINCAGFVHGGAEKLFGYEYLSGSNLLHRLTKPNGMTLTQSYEEHRDLLTGMAYHRGTTLVAQREYEYDSLGRPTARNTARKGTVVNDSFTHNTRSELTAATVSGSNYAYNYDNIGNRTTATEGDESTTYTANALNQYTAIQENEEAAFTPLFDADGNQTRIKTETGIWSVQYNAENRPVSFTNAESNTVVECAYDSMGRRAYKKVTSNGTVTLHQRYIYRGYLQIAALDLTRSNHPALWFITWDPTQPIATRPLSIRINGTWYTYGWDLTKNICELYSTGGGIATSYTYTPFGKVTSFGNVTQPIQWSSEYQDYETELYAYLTRMLMPNTGRWINRDVLEEFDAYNWHSYCKNNPVLHSDYLGMAVLLYTTDAKLSNEYETSFNIPRNTIDELIKETIKMSDCNFDELRRKKLISFNNIIPQSKDKMLEWLQRERRLSGVYYVPANNIDELIKIIKQDISKRKVNKNYDKIFIIHHGSKTVKVGNERISHDMYRRKTKESFSNAEAMACEISEDGKVTKRMIVPRVLYRLDKTGYILTRWCTGYDIIQLRMNPVIGKKINR